METLRSNVQTSPVTTRCDHFRSRVSMRIEEATNELGIGATNAIEARTEFVLSVTEHALYDCENNL